MPVALSTPVAKSGEVPLADVVETALLEVMRDRKPLDFYIVDADLSVHIRRGHNTGAGADRLPDEIRVAAQELLDANPGDSAVIPVRRDLALRMLRLYTGAGTRYALFLEPYHARDFVIAAVKRYALTLREGTMLDLILRGMSTSDIAAQLTITDRTVQQHLKNLGGKVGVTKRNAIVAKVLGLFAD